MGYVLAKEIVSLLSLQLMYSYLNELTLYAGVLYRQHSSSSWPHSDITSLGNFHFLGLAFLYSRDVFGIYQLMRKGLV